MIDPFAQQREVPVEDVLRNSEFARPRLIGRGSVEFRLIRVVSLCWLNESWTILRGFQGAEDEAHGVLRHLKWSPPKDGNWTLTCTGDPRGLEREYLPAINMSIVDCDLDPDDLSPWIGRLADVRVPLAGFSGLHGCDGETYELIVPRSGEEIRFKWWCDGPPEWHSLTCWAQDFALWSSKRINKAKPGMLQRFLGKK